MLSAVLQNQRSRSRWAQRLSGIALITQTHVRPVDVIGAARKPPCLYSRNERLEREAQETFSIFDIHIFHFRPAPEILVLVSGRPRANSSVSRGKHGRRQLGQKFPFRVLSSARGKRNPMELLVCYRSTVSFKRNLNFARRKIVVD